MAGFSLIGTGETKKENVLYSPNIHKPYEYYAPTTSASYQVGYTAPVYQIESPHAVATSKKEQTMRTQQTPKYVLTETQPQIKANESGLSSGSLTTIAVVGILGLGAFLLLKK